MLSLHVALATKMMKEIIIDYCSCQKIENIAKFP